MHRRLPITALAVLVLAACPDPGGEDAPGWTLQELCPEASARMCDFVAACDGLEVGTGGGDCVTSATAECESQITDRVAPEIDAGRLAYDGEKAQRCYESVYEETTCVGLFSQDPLLTNADCRGMLAGQVPLGDPCYEPWVGTECAEGYCRFDGACPGTCTRYPALDEHCDLDTPCDPMTATCDQEAGVCRALGDAGDGCGNGRECLPGLMCVPSSETASTCTELQPEGSSCTRDWECRTFICSQGTCAVERPLGEACDLSYECGPDALCYVPADATDWEAVCGPPLAEGDACRHGGTCADGLRCDTSGGSPGTCVARPALGEACGVDCADGLWCNEGTCAALGGEGDACDPMWPSCGDAFYCDDPSNVCRPVKADGEACSRYAECRHDCVDGVCGFTGSACLPD